jgi:hypothetical protein
MSQQCAQGFLLAVSPVGEATHIVINSLVSKPSAVGQGKEFGLNMALTSMSLISRVIPLLLRRIVCVQLISKTVAVNEEKFEPISFFIINH